MATSTIADTKTLSGLLATLATNQAQYGKNSTQAAQAQQNLNAQMALFGNTVGVKAELQLAKNAAALNSLFDATSGTQRMLVANIGEQGLKVGQVYLPLILAAAQTNLTIIDNSLKPLFTWLKGPDGVGIFHNLEREFAATLPAAMSAFVNGVELVLRVVNIASTYTGGFTTHLDHLLTRLNSMDNAQLGTVVGRYVADFRLWEKFVKLLIVDLYLLFHQDVGTGNSIIGALTTMLVHLHTYETSARGSAQIQSIFMVHKTEVLELLAVLAKLGALFSHVYIAIAPALVAAMNNVVLPVLTVVARVIASIAKASPFAATVLGLTLIASKAGGVMATAMAIKSLVMWLTGMKTASEALGAAGILKGAATGVAAGAAGGAAAGAAGGLGITELGATGLGALGAGGIVPIIASAAATALPVLIAGGAVALVAKGWACSVPGARTSAPGPAVAELLRRPRMRRRRTRPGAVEFSEGRLPASSRPSSAVTHST